MRKSAAKTKASKDIYDACQNVKKTNKQANKQSCGHICTQDGKCQNATTKKLVLLIWQLHDQKKQQHHRKKSTTPRKHAKKDNVCKIMQCAHQNASTGTFNPNQSWSMALAAFLANCEFVTVNQSNFCIFLK